MKYLNALLKGEEIPRHTRGEEPLKPLKPVSEVLEGAHGRSAGEIEQAPEPSWTCSGCGRRVPLTEETAEGRRRYLCPNGDGYISIPHEPGTPYIPSAKEQPFPPGNRDFLSRPLGQEDAHDGWDAWTTPL